MCGLFGTTGLSDQNLTTARDALNLLSHRGPDQWNEYISKNIFLGHRRLSILDLTENGKQPMVNENESVIITVNGEIYNFAALKKQLIGKYKFYSTSDSEVLLNGYQEWGIDQLLDKMDGMYAFSIYDKIQNKIYLGRDRCGIKPIYYSIKSGVLTWASELKAIVHFWDEKNLTVDKTAIYDFYTYQYIPAPKTLYEEIYKLEPAHYLIWDLDKKIFTTKKYWELPISHNTLVPEEAKTTLYQLVTESVNEQMISDVPIGFFLSGGIDSSIIVGLASKLSSNIKTFNIGFKNNPDDESTYAQIVADYFNTQHFKKILSPEEVNNDFNLIKKWYDEPFADLSCFPTHLVSKTSKTNVTVVLTGDGGDEIFGGYKWYRAFYLISKIQSFPGFFILKKMINLILIFFKKSNADFKILKYLQLLLYKDLVLYTKLLNGFTAHEKTKLRKKLNISDEYDDYWYFRKYYRKDLPVFSRLRYLDFHTYLPDDILTKVDRVSMDVSLECRVPLLSKKIIEFAFSLPDQMIMLDGKLKGFLKFSFAELLPKQILRRNKQGFNIPVSTWKAQLNKKHSNRMDRIVFDVFKLKF